jgi:uracil-DNA glycosylase family 4
VQCTRLAEALVGVRRSSPSFHARPVAAFGDTVPRLLIVGLAPGLNGANRTGRPFTGDYAGVLLYETLHKFGWSSAPVSSSRDDGLAMQGCRITNAVKCWPPENKPLPAEVNTCNAYLQAELNALPEGAAILALGQIAHRAVVQGFGLRQATFTFGHGVQAELPNARRLFDSYHCSRYNTQTRRMTASMFEDVFTAIDVFLKRA